MIIVWVPKTPDPVWVTYFITSKNFASQPRLNGVPYAP